MKVDIIDNRPKEKDRWRLSINEDSVRLTNNFIDYLVIDFVKERIYVSDRVFRRDDDEFSQNGYRVFQLPSWPKED